MLTLYKRVFTEAKVKHQSLEEPLTHAVYDVHAARAKSNERVLADAERNRSHQERRLGMLARRTKTPIGSYYPRQPYQTHGEHAHQLARIQVARHGKVRVDPTKSGMQFAGNDRDRAAHAHRFATEVNRLHGEGSAQVSERKHPEYGPVHHVSLNLPDHSDEERQKQASEHERLLNDAHNRLVKTGGEHIEWREHPRTLGERMFLQSVKSGKAKSKPILDKRTGEPIRFRGHPDPKYKDWRGYNKSRSSITTAKGDKIIIHFWEHPETKHRVGFKFKPQKS